jgi:hypothetical protein
VTGDSHKGTYIANDKFQEDKEDNEKTTSNVHVHIAMRRESIDKERHEDITGITNVPVTLVT